MQIMKNLKIKSLIILLALIAEFGFHSCTKDPAIIVTPKTLSQYVAEQLPFVKSELPIVRKCVVGYDKGNYSFSVNAVVATSLATVKAAYLAALVADSALIVSSTVTIPQIVTANQALGAPGKAFWAAINLCDKRPLNDAIVTATALNTSTLVGTAVGNVTTDAKAAFTLAIKAASTTRDASTTTIDRQVTEAIDKLKIGTTAFNSAIIK
jgi:hypothetical protein